MKYHLIITAGPSLALGNGTRRQGFCLADVDCDEPQAVLDAAFNSLSRSLDVLRKVCAVEPREGVEPVEILTLLRNSHQCELRPAPTPVAGGSREPSETRSGDDGPSVELRSTPIADLKLPKPIREALEAAGLKTAGDVVDYGEANQGLTKIEGIREPTEAKVVEALRKLFA